MERKRAAAIIIVVAAVIAFNLAYNALPLGGSATVCAPAIGGDGKGLLVEFKLFLQRGSGRTLVDVENAEFKTDAERALRTAKLNAETFLGVKLSGFDVVLEARGPRGFKEVSGESAGAAFSVAIVSLATGRKLRDDAVVSAVISDDGKILPVGGVEEKIIAAQEAGKRLFVVAGRQEIKFEEQLREKIEIRRVDSLGEAVELLLA